MTTRSKGRVKRPGRRAASARTGSTLPDPVPPAVLDHGPDRRGVDVRGRNEPRSPGERQGERAGAGEHVEHPLAGHHEPGEALPLGRKAGREVDLGKVDPEDEAVLADLRHGRRLAREHGEAARPVRPLDMPLGSHHGPD